MLGKKTYAAQIFFSRGEKILPPREKDGASVAARKSKKKIIHAAAAGRPACLNSKSAASESVAAKLSYFRLAPSSINSPAAAGPQAAWHPLF